MLFMKTTYTSQADGIVPTPSGGVDLRPPSYLVLSIIVTINCAILFILTIMVGIPAIVLSVMVRFCVTGCLAIISSTLIIAFLSIVTVLSIIACSVN